MAKGLAWAGMRPAVLLAATIASGLLAGLFYAYSISVMRALRETSPPVFVEVLQRINRTIQNGWFALSFAGAPLLTGLAVVLYAVAGPSAVLVPVIIGLVLQAGQLALTFGLNIPLNNRLDRAADPVTARGWFETRWVRGNHARTLLSTGSFGSLCWALLAA